MSDKTHIEWTEATWNPVTGCSKVTQGCKHCYAERDWKRLAANPGTRYYGREFTDVIVHGDVKFWYELDRPENATDEAFVEYVSRVRDAGYAVLIGKA